MNIFGRLFGITVCSILALYLASFASFLVPQLNAVFFVGLVVGALVLTVYKFEYGLLVMLAEIFVGSKGYLFWVDIGDARISLRMALFAIVVGVWAAKQIANSLATRGLAKRDKWQIVSRPYAICHMPYALLAIAIAWGIFNGWLRGNSLSNIFHDANAWVYFLLVPIFISLSLEGRGLSPVGDVATSGEGEFWSKFVQVFLGAVSAMVVKSFVLLYLFSHEFSFPILYVYPWLRKFLLGEITVPEGGWPRIFFQSQIYVLIGFFVLIVLLIGRARERGEFPRTIRLGETPSPCPLPPGEREKIETGFSPRLSLYGRGPRPRSGGEGALALLFLTSACLGVVIMSFSRSFWVGLVAGMGVLFTTLYVIPAKAGIQTRINLDPDFHRGDMLKKIVRFFSLSCVVALIILLVTTYFPFPKPISIDFLSAFKDRLTDLSEAAVRSRWDLVQPLWAAVAQHPLLGSGFGSTVTYHSSDPRAVALSVNGMFTTFTFEWGYLDIWLKLGLFGLVMYIALLGSILWRGWSTIDKMFSPFAISHLPHAFTLGLLVLAVVHFFSPYLNHPLGIVYVVLVERMVAMQQGRG